MSGLRINTNIQALNAQRNLNVNTGLLGKTLERLSSGLRINRASDDAAGLAISETLRAQIRGMDQAVANAQDGINLIQTAEGGLTESTNILHRMRELAIQAANDTYTQSDREKIDIELAQLREELTRIASTTQFNGRNLLDGSASFSTTRVDARVAINENQRVGAINAAGVPVFGDMIDSVTLDPVSQATATVDVALTFKLIATSVQGEYDLEIRGSDGTFQTINDYNTAARGQTVALNLQSGAIMNVAFGAVSVENTDVGDTGTIQLTGVREAVLVNRSMTLQIGANEGQFLKSGIADFRAAALHLESISVLGATENDSRVNAQNLIGVIDEAMAFINAERARMGALQNRLEHTVASLGVSSENLQASEARIRDADVAKESAALMRAQILVQAGTSVLSQANTAPQTALNLLRN